jgi:hypothetical protein
MRKSGYISNIAKAQPPDARDINFFSLLLKLIILMVTAGFFTVSVAIGALAVLGRHHG